MRPCILHTTPILFCLIWWRLEVAYEKIPFVRFPSMSCHSVSLHLGPKLSPKHPILKMLPPTLKSAKWLTNSAQCPISWTKTFVWRGVCLEVSVLLLRNEHSCIVTYKSQTEGSRQVSAHAPGLRISYNENSVSKYFGNTVQSPSRQPAVTSSVASLSTVKVTLVVVTQFLVRIWN